jgi:hypothetical protein
MRSINPVIAWLALTACQRAQDGTCWPKSSWRTATGGYWGSSCCRCCLISCTRSTPYAKSLAVEALSVDHRAHDLPSAEAPFLSRRHQA